MRGGVRSARIEVTSFLPLSPVRDNYLQAIASGDTGPDNGIVIDISRPLVFYRMDAPGELKLTRNGDTIEFTF